MTSVERKGARSGERQSGPGPGPGPTGAVRQITSRPDDRQQIGGRPTNQRQQSGKSWKLGKVGTGAGKEAPAKIRKGITTKKMQKRKKFGGEQGGG